jgi:outer membrane protein assembly factor BamD
MLQKRLVIFVLTLCLLPLISCNEFNKVQKSGTVMQKYDAAIKYYDKKEYYKANLLLEEILPNLKGQTGVEKGLFYYAYTHYYGKQYVMSAYYFKEFYQTYPRSEFAHESMFMNAKSLFNDSPAYNLDQTNTSEAMRALQSFANRYPNSSYMEEVNKMSDDLRKKLEVKAYENAKHYYKLGSYNPMLYKSAVIAFNNFQKSYPDSQFNEEVSFLRVESQYNLAKGSFEVILKNGNKVYLKKDRLYEAIEFYHNFIDKYPGSKYKKAADNMYQDCQHLLSTLNS